jgi:multicomponent K+:H+ antiporter subunit D
LTHLLIIPIVLPLCFGALLILTWSLPVRWQRWISLLATLALLETAVALWFLATPDKIFVYLLGDWPAPFGITLLLDQFAAWMLLLTAVLALPVLIYAIRDHADRMGRHFHALFQLQLMGLNGAFLTADLFTLFVCFELLLFASYGLFIQGGGLTRSRATLHYVIVNSIGSLVFLLGLALLYATVGTLNMADLAKQLALIPPAAEPMILFAGLLLGVVFALKAALIPFHFSVADVYAAAPPAVAALSAIMTKVGFYALVRLLYLVYGQTDFLQQLHHLTPGIVDLALLTLLIGTVGVLTSATLQRGVAFMVLISSGTLLLGLATATPAGLSAALYYMPHATLMTAALFLLADLITRARGGQTVMTASAIATSSTPLGLWFLIAAMAMIGLPPFGGFVGKVLLLQATATADANIWIWSAVLGSGLLLIFMFTQNGINLFWRGTKVTSPVLDSWQVKMTGLLLSSTLLFALGAGPLTAHTQAIARQIMTVEHYIQAVMDQRPLDPQR